MKKILTAGLSFIVMAFAVSSFGAYKPRVDVFQGFVTTNTLGIGGNYDSSVLNLRDYTQVQTHVDADQDGTINIEFCSDTGGVDVVRSLSIPYLEANGFQMFSAPAFTPYVRYQFTNTSGSAQTDFFYETKFLTKGLTPQLLRADAFISPSMVAALGRNVVVGVDPAGTYRNVPVDTEGHLKVNLNDPLTSFGEVRTAELTPQVQLQFPYNINSDIVDTTLANGGTVISTNSMARLATSTATTGDAILASRAVVHYRSGQGTLARFTGMFTAGTAGANQIIGIGDATDGFFFGYSNTVFGLLTRKDGTDTWTPQTAWNVDDLSGSNGPENPSNMTLAHTNLNVFEITFQWLGAGEIEFFVENPATGGFIPVHRVQYANNFQEPSIFNPSLTMYAQVIKTSGATDIQLHTASMAGFTEGKDVPLGPVNTYSQVESVDENEGKVLILRNNSTFQGKTNKVRLILKALSVGNDTTAASKFTIYRNPTLAGTETWVTNAPTTSVISTDAVQTYSSGGRVLFDGYCARESGAYFDLSDLNIQVLPGELIAVTAENVSATTPASQAATLIWQEDF